MMGHQVVSPTRSAPALVPTLDQVAADPARVQALSRDALVALYREAASLEALLRAELLASPPDRTPGAEIGDRLLSVQEAAAKLGCSPDWVYRNQRDLPVVKLGRHRKLSARGLDAFIARRQGRP